MKRPPAVIELLEQLQRMPGIGQKTAERLSFFLMRGSEQKAYKLADAIYKVKEKKKSFDQSQDKSEAEIIQNALDVFGGVVIK